MESKLKIYEHFELWFLDLGIRLLSRSDKAQLFWRETYQVFSSRQLFWFSLLISVSSFMGLISSYFFYTLIFGA